MKYRKYCVILKDISLITVLTLRIEYVIENPTDIEKYGGQAVVAHSLVNNVQ